MEYRPFPNLAHKNLLQESVEVPTLVRALHIPYGRDVLEVGCGRGIALPPLARLLQPRRLVGVDVDAAEFVHADVRALPFPDQSFDVVVDFGTCYHVEGAERALAEVARVLRPHG